MAFVKEKCKALDNTLDAKALDQKVLEELEKGNEERKEKIDMLYQKFDGTNSRLEKIKSREQKALQERYAKQIDPKRAEEQKLFEMFEKELERWSQYEAVGKEIW